MHYYKRNLGDYAKKAGRLSMLEHGAYTLLLDACYDRERFPTEAEAIEWAWARTEVEIAAVRFVLSRFFALTDGVYVQERIAEELATYQRNAENNARIAKEREEKRKKSARTVHEACDSGNEAPPNHKPITNNQEPNKDIGSASPERPTKTVTARMLAAEGVEKQTADDWLTLRRAKRLPLTQTAWADTKAEGEKVGLCPGGTVAHAVKSNWAGFKASWYTRDAAAGAAAAAPMGAFV